MQMFQTKGFELYCPKSMQAVLIRPGPCVSTVTENTSQQNWLSYISPTEGCRGYLWDQPPDVQTQDKLLRRSLATKVLNHLKCNWLRISMVISCSQSISLENITEPLVSPTLLFQDSHGVVTKYHGT